MSDADRKLPYTKVRVFLDQIVPACELCGADVIERVAMAVDFEGERGYVCGDCWEQDDEPEEPPFDWNREGQPEFTGVFG